MDSTKNEQLRISQHMNEWDCIVLQSGAMTSPQNDKHFYTIETSLFAGRRSHRGMFMRRNLGCMWWGKCP